MGRHLRFALFIATALPHAVVAQVAVGRVTDGETGLPIVGADITILDADRAVVARSATGADGSYAVSPDAPGDYIVTADQLGHLRLESPLASFPEGRSINIDFELPIDPIELDGLRVEAERQAELRRRVAMYGVRVEQLGARFIARTEIEKRQTATDFGPAIEWQSLPSIKVIRSDDTGGGPPRVCVQYRGGGCAMNVLNGAPVPLEIAASVPPDALQAIVVLTPMEATLSYGTAGGNGAVLLFTREGR